MDSPNPWDRDLQSWLEKWLFSFFFFKAKIIFKTPIFIGVTKCKNND